MICAAADCANSRPPLATRTWIRGAHDRIYKNQKTERHSALGVAFPPTQRKENAMSKLSRRSLVTAAAAQDERKLVMLADEIERAWNDVGNEADESAGADVLWRRIEEATDAMDEICARSIPGLIAKARVADLRLRVNGEPHSEGRYAWSVIDDLLALGSAA